MAGRRHILRWWGAWAVIAAAAALLVTLVVLSAFPPTRYRAEDGMVTVSDSHRHPPPIPAPPGHR